MTDIQKQIELDRKVRSLRTAVSYTASDIGSLAATWQPDQHTQLQEIESELQKLIGHVAALRTLHDSL